MQIECPLCQARYPHAVEYGLGGDYIAECPACGAEFTIGVQGVGAPDVVWEEPTVVQDSPFGEDWDDAWIDEAPAPRALPRAEEPLARVRLGERTVAPKSSRVVVADEPVAVGPPPERAWPAPVEAVVPAPPPAPPVLEPSALEPEETDRLRPRRPQRRWPAIALAGGLAAAAIVTFVSLRPEVTPTEDPALAALALDAAPTEATADASPPPARAANKPPGQLSLEIYPVEALAEEGAVVVYGALSNATDVDQTRIEIEAILTVDGVPRRRRAALCCDDLTPAQAKEVAAAPAHPHFRRERDPVVVAAGDVQAFAIVFPSLAPAQVKGVLAASVRIERAEPGDGRDPAKM